MSELSNLTELARFIGKSSLSSIDPAVRRRALAGITRRLDPRSQRRSVGDLLGVVLTLSARTRRLSAPRVEIDLDVFAPGGKRAVRIMLGKPGR